MIDIKYKQFVIIPKKPKMSAGKIASQTAHATYMALEQDRKHINPKDDTIMCRPHNYIEEWKESGMCVIVLECESTQQLMGIAKYFEQWGIHHHLYIDEGLTEIPMGTATALATGVLTEDKFWMLSMLELYK